ncbi:MAG TPA: ABC transporter substrate-binding protein [Solirubrobacterales bacterium]|nr:ABC transporter substrate-binding protein [Solirubrobacterales bacterium]
MEFAQTLKSAGWLADYRAVKRLAPIAAVVALVVALACGVAGCGGGSGAQSGTLTATFASFPDSLDPGLSFSGEGSTALYDTYIPLLTYAHADGEAGSEVVPGLATAMPKISDGGRTYELTLRKGLRYSDGSPVRASDFAHAIERVFLLNSPGSPFYEDIVGAREFAQARKGGIRGIETDDRSGRIVIHLLAPRGTFVNEMGLPFAAPLPAATPAKDQTADPPPATGPYEIVRSQPGRGWEYRRNPQWKANNAALVPEVPDGHVDRIDVQVVHNRSSQVDGVERGRYDWMGNPPPADRYADVQSSFEGTQFDVHPTVSTYYFWLNTTQPPFDDVRVRRAVNLAVDRAALERIYAGQIVGTEQILPPGMPGYRRIEPYPHSLAKARAEIAAAAPADRSITVWSDNESPNDEAAAYYQDVLEDLGFDVELKVVDADAYFGLIGNSSTPDLDTGVANWFEDYPHPNDFFQPLISEDGIANAESTNLARFADPAISAEIARLGEQTLGPRQESEYAALDRRTMEAAPWVPYGNATLPTFVSSAIDLDEVIFNPTFSQDLTSFRFK